MLSDDEHEPSDLNRVNVVWTALLVEGIFVVVALALSFLGIFASQQPLHQMAKTIVNTGAGIYWILIGVLAALPLIAVYWLIDRTQPAFYQPMRQLVERFFYPMFREASWFELLVISLAAGFGEEMLFRWCLQGGLQEIFTGAMGQPAAIALSVLVVSLLFGACHGLNRVYFVMAAVAGAYLGIVMLVSDSWIAAAVTHTVFDLWALLKIRWFIDPLPQR